MNSIFKYHLFLHNSNNSSVSSVGIGFKHQKCEPVCHPWRQFGFLGRDPANKPLRPVQSAPSLPLPKKTFYTKKEI